MKAIKIPCEHDLLSKNHDTWANAVMRCKGGSPDCGADGYCHVGGGLFAMFLNLKKRGLYAVSHTVL